MLVEELVHQSTMTLQDVVQGRKGKKGRFASWGTVYSKVSSLAVPTS